MTERNTTTFEIEGVERGFKFGTYTFKIIQKDLGGENDPDKVLKGLTDGDLGAVAMFYHACAIHWHKYNKKPIDFEEVHVMEWIEDLGHERMSEISKVMLESFQIKNQAAPVTGLQPSMNGKH